MGGGGAAGADAAFGIPTQGPSGWRGLVQNKKALGLATFASLGGVLYGYNQGVFAQVQVMYSFQLRYSEILGDPSLSQEALDASVDGIRKGLLTSILELGAFVGAIMAGPISDAISRKRSISIWCVVFMVGTALQVGATRNVDFIWAGRWIGGMAVGALSMLVPMYNGELAPPGIRGSLVALQQLAITFGILISYWISYGTNYIGGTRETQSDVAWRLPLALQLVPAVILCIGAFFLPYSPRWLMLKGREEECLLTLANLRDAEENSLLVQSEYMALQAERLVQEDEINERYGPGRSQYYYALQDYIRLLTTKSLLHRLFLGASAQALQQWSGINAVIYYAPTIFKSIGLAEGTSGILATGIVGVVNFVFTIPACLFVDNWGRKPTLFIGSVALATCLAIIAAIVAQFGDDWANNETAGNTAVAFLYIYIAVFACTWGPLAWVVSTEVFPLSLRAKGMSFSSATNWLMNFCVATITPIALQNIGYKTYILFMVMMIVGALWAWFLLPELKNKTLEEIDNFFRDQSGAEDAARRQKIARQIGLDKLPVQEVKHQEEVSHSV